VRILESLLFRPEPENNAEAAVFHSDVVFSGIQVGSDANFRGVQFLGSGNQITFDGAKIDKNAVFVGCRFVGKTRFIAMRVGGQASFQGAKFIAPVTFDAARIAGRALFRAEPSHSLEGTSFGDLADFRDCSIGSTAEFRSAKFLGETNFERATFEGSAIFISALFGSADSWNRFGGMKCKQGAYFQASKFVGKADFHGITVHGEWICSGAVFGDEVTFEGSTFFDSAYFSGREGLPPARFSDVAFSFSKFERIADFEGTTFGDLLTLRETYMRAVLFTAATCSQFSSTVDMRGFRYDSISVDWKHLLRNAAGKPRLRPFDRQPYTGLEKALRSEGHDRDADQVYLERRHVERKLKWKEAKHLWAGDFLYWLLGRYGIRPYQLFAIALSFIFFGAFVYRMPSSVKVSTDVDGKKVWTVASQISVADAVRLSLRKVFPVELPLVTQYEPWEKNRVSSDYSGLLRAVGWLILPIGIAAITGLLRRVAK
jgi:uncharacterized protein YjbI with pentapeptide repeats